MREYVKRDAGWLQSNDLDSIIRRNGILTILNQHDFNISTALSYGKKAAKSEREYAEFEIDAKIIYDSLLERYMPNMSYESMVSSFCESIIYSAVCGEYQGDEIYIITKAGMYGLSVVGFGSCSGCDALLACDTVDDLKELRRAIKDDVRWFSCLKEMREYIFDDETKKTNWWANDEETMASLTTFFREKEAEESVKWE